MKTMSRYNSIGFRLAVIFICAVLAQCLVMGFMLVAGGVISETANNSYGYFSSQVESRKANFESQMKLIWTDFSTVPEQIGQVAAEYKASTPMAEQNDDDLLRAVAPHLIELLKRTKTTGAFLILPNKDAGENQENVYSSLYIRNLNPNQKGQNSYNFTLKAGPIDLKKTYGFGTSDKWAYKLELDETNEEFYKKAYQNMQFDVAEKLLCYWSKPFTLKGDTENVIAYSIPIKDANGQELGILGVDLEVSYLYEFLPKADLVGDNSLGFIIGMRNEPDGELYPVIAKEKLHGKVISLEEPLELSPKNKGYDIYEIDNSKGESHVFACEKELEMYTGNTLFSNEQWYLVGLMNKSELLKFSDRISEIMKWSLGITVIFGIIAAVFITRKFSGPITNLANEVRGLSGAYDFEGKTLSKIGLYEIDQLSEAILTAQRSLSELNDKLKYERDQDSMTGIRNRNAFNAEMEACTLKINTYQNICIGLFDLNGLKQVNDNYGHEYGDRYICDSAQMIGKVFHERPLYRIGGDEFAIIMTNLDAEMIEQKKKSLTALIAEYNKQSKFEVGIAFGYDFCSHSEEDSLEQALRRADMNMYAAKKMMKEQRI